MTSKEKDLLLRDLCARQLHRVKVLYEGRVKEIQYIEPLYYEVKLLDSNINYTVPISNLKPYLRPLSSMTEEELHEIQEILGKGVEIREDFIVSVDSSINSFTYLELIAVFEWLLKKHFDFMGLIPKGLAIEVTESNNPYKE